MFQGTGVGKKRNPSDPASQGLDLKTATLRIHFRVSTSPNYINLKSEEEEEETRSLTGSNHDDQQNGMELPGWEAVLWRGRLYISKFNLWRKLFFFQKQNFDLFFVQYFYRSDR